MVVFCLISPDFATYSLGLHKHLVSVVVKRLSTFPSLALSTLGPMFILLDLLKYSYHLSSFWKDFCEYKFAFQQLSSQISCSRSLVTLHLKRKQTAVIHASKHYDWSIQLFSKMQAMIAFHLCRRKLFSLSLIITFSPYCSKLIVLNEAKI